MPTPTQAIRFNPEAIAIALFNLLQAIPQSSFPFQTFDRKGLIWANVNPADQPYLALIERGATAVQDTTMGLEKWRLHYIVLVYTRADAETGASVPATSLNAALLAIFNAIASIPPGERQTLGSLGVVNVWIDGQIYIDTGILDQQCAMMIPVTVELGI